VIRTELIASVSELLGRHASHAPERVAFRDRRGAISYGELFRSTGNIARNLARLGIRAGDRVAIWLPNSVAWIEACFGIARARAVCVPISHDAALDEAVYRLADSGSRIVIATAQRAESLAGARNGLPGLEEVIVIGDGGGQGRRYEDLTREPVAAADRTTEKAAIDDVPLDDVGWILYTSGTTGKAKGVALTYRSMMWVVAACWAPIAGYSADDYLLSPLPLFHSYALNLTVLGTLAVGATAFITDRYSTRECLEMLSSEPFTLFAGVPTMFHYLLDGAAGKEARFKAITRCVSAGAIMPATLNRAFERRFGVPLLDGYGITETSTIVTMNWPSGTRIMGSCGLPLPGLAVRIVDPAGAGDREAGEEGELIVRGPNLMGGYHGKPAETAAAIRDGWYHTGDLARADAHGYVTITGRLKELIIRGGQNIAPGEIEEVAAGCEGVLDCAAAGVPHEYLGEVPVLFVVAKAGHALEAGAVIAQCRAHLSAYKVPVAVHFIDEIPRTGSGKVMRFRLREKLGESI